MTQHMVVFSVSNEEFALPVENVKEIQKVGEVTKIPHIYDYVEGVSHIRNHPVGIINLAKKLGLPQQPNTLATTLLISKSRDTIVGLLVDRVSEVCEIPDKNIEKTPGFAMPINDGYVKMISDVKGRIVLILDLDEVLTQEELENVKNLNS